VKFAADMNSAAEDRRVRIVPQAVGAEYDLGARPDDPPAVVLKLHRAEDGGVAQRGGPGRPVIKGDRSRLPSCQVMRSTNGGRAAKRAIRGSGAAGAIISGRPPRPRQRGRGSAAARFSRRAGRAGQKPAA